MRLIDACRRLVLLKCPNFGRHNNPCAATRIARGIASVDRRQRSVPP